MDSIGTCTGVAATPAPAPASEAQADVLALSLSLSRELQTVREEAASKGRQASELAEKLSQVEAQLAVAAHKVLEIAAAPPGIPLSTATPPRCASFAAPAVAPPPPPPPDPEDVPAAADGKAE